MKKMARANETKKNIVKGDYYFIESTGIGTVFVYDLRGNYIDLIRLDAFENIENY